MFVFRLPLPRESCPIVSILGFMISFCFHSVCSSTACRHLPAKVPLYILNNFFFPVIRSFVRKARTGASRLLCTRKQQPRAACQPACLKENVEHCVITSFKVHAAVPRLLNQKRQISNEEQLEIQQTERCVCIKCHVSCTIKWLF